MIKRLHNHNHSEFPHSPVVLNVRDRMIELFGNEFLKDMLKCGREIQPIVQDPHHPEALSNAVLLRQNLGGNLRWTVRAMRRGDMLRHQMEDAGSQEPTLGLLTFMPPIIFDTLVTFNDDYTQDKGKKAPVGKVSDALDASCVLTFAAGALDIALMDFYPSNPTDSRLCRLSNLADLSRKVVILAGPTAAGKDAVLDGFLKLRLGIPFSDAVEREHLFERAQSLGISRLTKLTGRARRGNEVDGVSYYFFDGGDLVLDGGGRVMQDPLRASPMKDSTRPPESKLLELRNAGDGPLAYSYLYSEHRYAFAGSDILPHVSDKPFEVIGLEDTLQDSRVNMLVLGSGTTPEVLYLKDLLPNATVLYVIPGRSTDAIVSLERSLRARWWARELGILKRDVTVRGESAWPADLTGFSTSIEDNVRFRFHEVTPQMVLALICGEQIPGFNIVSNRPGLSFLRSASDGLNGVFRRSGNFPKIFV